MPSKVLVTNCDALRNKYGSGGLKAVMASVKKLIAADKSRGLTSALIDLSNNATMRKYKGKAVADSSSAKENKDAVDSVYRAVKPDYIVILDGPDVVPHLPLRNPTPDDKDGVTIPSDLPYASDAPFTKRDGAHYAAVTRVVGRIPGITGAAGPAFLVAQLRKAAQFKSRPRKDYAKLFAISASTWRESTELSVEAILAGQRTGICPPLGHPGVN